MKDNNIKLKAYLNNNRLMENFAESIYFKMFNEINLPINLDFSLKSLSVNCKEVKFSNIELNDVSVKDEELLGMINFLNLKVSAFTNNKLNKYDSNIVKALIISNVVYNLLFINEIDVNNFNKEVFILKYEDLFEKYFWNDKLNDEELFIINFSTIYLIPRKPFKEYSQLKYSSNKVLSSIFEVPEIVIKYRKRLLEDN
jgi:hypothetical protein